MASYKHAVVPAGQTPPREIALEQRNTGPPSSRLELGPVHHSGDNIASHSYGSRVDGHVVNVGEGNINIETNNTHNYSLALGSVLNLSTSTFDERLSVVGWLESLASLDFLPTHLENLHERHEEAGAWFLTDDKFMTWLDGTTRTLWCHGILGCGKSILSSTIIEHLETIGIEASPASACVFIFFDYRKKASQTIHNLTIEILKQLVRQRAQLSDSVRQLHAKYTQRATLPNSTELVSVIKNEISQFSRVRMVVDGLDECPAQVGENTREKFFQVLRRLPSAISFFVTSRDNHYANCGLGPVDEIRFTPTVSDLENFVRSQIHTHSADNEALASTNHDAIVRRVVNHAGRMFLLARLHMNDIAAQHTPADIQQALESLPSSVESTYDKAVQRIEPRYKPLAERVFMWLTFALRPLTLCELIHALAVNEKITKSDMLDKHVHNERHLVTVCAGLIAIDRENKVGVVRLVHPTAQAYFDSQLDHVKGHETLALTCLQYLLFEDLSKQASDQAQLSKRLQHLPFLRYAAFHWGDHARRVDDPKVNNVALTFLQDRSNMTSAAQVMDFTDGEDVSALWTAAHYGLRAVMDHLLESESDVVDALVYGETAMHAAARNGHVSAVAQLLKHNALSDVVSEDGRTPLSLAAENGHDSVVSLLLSSDQVETDSQTTTPFYEGRTPFSWAAGNGHHDIVEQLLTTGRVDVNSTVTRGTYRGRTPLIWAAHDGHEETVRLLLEKGRAKSSEVDSDAMTALSHAAQNGNEGAVRRLLEEDPACYHMRDGVLGRRPVDWCLANGHEALVKVMLTYPSLDFADQQARTTLSYEAESGDLDLVKLLLEYGADPNHSDEEGWTPLIHAVENGNVEVVKLLIRRGADPGSVSEDCRTALSYAAQAGHTHIVQVLLSNDAHPDLPDRFGRTPLSYAAEAGQKTAVALLLSLEKKVDPDSHAMRGLFRGRTPLSVAAGRGKVDIVKMLLDVGVEVNLKADVSPETAQPPIIWAEMHGHENVVKTLLETGKVKLGPEDNLFGVPAHQWAREHAGQKRM